MVCLLLQVIQHGRPTSAYVQQVLGSVGMPLPPIQPPLPSSQSQALQAQTVHTQALQRLEAVQQQLQQRQVAAGLAKGGQTSGAPQVPPADCSFMQALASTDFQPKPCRVGVPSTAAAESSGCEWHNLQASSGPALLMKQNPWGGSRAQMGWRPATSSGAGLPNQKPALSRAGTPPTWPASVGNMPVPLHLSLRPSAAGTAGQVAAPGPQSAPIGPPEQPPLRAGSPPKQPAQPSEQPGPASVAAKGQAQPAQPAASALKVESGPEPFAAGETQAQVPAGPVSTPAARHPVSAELPAAALPVPPADTAMEQAEAPDEPQALGTAWPGAVRAEPVATQAEPSLKREQAAEQQQGTGVEPTHGRKAAEKVDASDRGPGPMAVDDLVRQRRRERRQRELQEQHRWGWHACVTEQQLNEHADSSMAVHPSQLLDLPRPSSLMQQVLLDSTLACQCPLHSATLASATAGRCTVAVACC